MGVVFGEMVGHAGDAGVHIGPAQVFGADHFAGGGFDQRRAAKEDGALVLDDDRLIAHCRDVGTAGGARAHHGGDLRDALGRQVGLVEEDAAKVFLVGENLILHGQESAAGINQIDTGQAVFQGDFLGAQVFFDGQRVVGAAFDRGVVGHDHAFDAMNAANAGDHRGCRHVTAIHAISGKLPDLQEGRARIEQAIDALAGEQLATRQVLLAGGFRAAEGDFLDLFMQVCDQAAHGVGVGLKVRRARIELGFEYCHCLLTAVCG